jgi:hypothetical protein
MHIKDRWKIWRHMASLGWKGLRGKEIQKTFFGISWPVKMEPIGCPERSVSIYHCTLRNNALDHWSNLNRGGSVKSRIHNRFFSKSSNINFDENPSSGNRVCPCGQTDGWIHRQTDWLTDRRKDGQTADMTKLIIVFSQNCIKQL